MRDACHVGGLLGGDEGDARPRPSRAARAPDAVHVAIAVGGRVEVDDEGDVVDVQAARGDVGGDQGMDLAGLEPGKRTLALSLRLVAVHGDRVHGLRAQALDQPVGAALGPHEHQRPAATVTAELADELVELVLVADRDEAVVDLGASLSRWGVLVLASVAGVGARNTPGLALERRREEEGLALGRDLGDDAVDGGAKAHVEHAVGLIEDEHLHVLERHGAAVDQVLEPARAWRRGCASARQAWSGARIPSRRRRRSRRGRGHARRLKLVDDLSGELARRREDERRRAPLRVGEPVDNRQAEGERLARAGRRLDEHVAPMQHVGYDEALDGEGLGDAPAGECVDNRSRHAEIGER